MNVDATSELPSPVEKIKQFFKTHDRYLLGISKMIVSIVGGEKQLRILENDILGSDLYVSDLHSQSRLKPLSGYQNFNVKEYGDIYPEGCRLSMTIGHNKVGNEQIILNGLYINVLDYIEGECEEISTKRSAKIIGAAVVKPLKFIAQLEGRQIVNPQWTYMPEVDGDIEILSDNLFDTNPPIKYSFEDPKDTLTLEGVLRATKPGLYILNLQFEYCIVGKGDYCIKTGVFYIYKE